MKFDVNVSIDDVSPHPRSSTKVIDQCYKLIDSFPDIKFTLFVPTAYWRTMRAEIATKEPLVISKYPEFCEELKKLPVVNFAAGGIATPADAALMMQLGCEGIFVGSGIFKSDDPKERAFSIVQATTHFDNPEVLKDISKNIGAAMHGINIDNLPEEDKLSKRGW